MLEIGLGTGRFAAPLGVGFGIDPTPRCSPTRERGTRTACAVAKALPFAVGVFY